MESEPNREPSIWSPLFNPRSYVRSDVWYNNYIPLQSTLPRGERPTKGGYVHTQSCTSIHAPAGGATQLSLTYIMLQSTLLRGGRPMASGFWVTIISYASIHAPAWGATDGVRFLGYDPIVCFNPRSCVGSDYGTLGVLAKLWCASIHAPAWGATQGFDQKTKQKNASIHAPAWGATRGCARYVKVIWLQSTLPQGERLQRIGLVGSGVASIHAPALGATQFKGFIFFYDCLQSTLPHGERHYGRPDAGDVVWLQSTLP